MREEIKKNIFNELVNRTNDRVPEVLIDEFVKKVFEKISDFDTYLELDENIEIAKQEIEKDFGKDNYKEKNYDILLGIARKVFDEYRGELIENGIITDIPNFNDSFEVRFDELNEKIGQTEKYLIEFFDLRDKKLEIIKDPNLSLDEKKEKILEINNSSNLFIIENEDVKKEYELLIQSSDEDLINMFKDDSISPEELSLKIDEYNSNWNEIVNKIYGTDIDNMNLLSKQIDAVLEIANKDLSDEYTSMCKELNFEKGSEEEKIFDEAFEDNCNEQLYINKMIDIKINENEEIKEIDEEIAEIEARIDDLLPEENDQKEKKELIKQKKSLNNKRDDLISKLKESLKGELHNRFERMANYQKKALRYTKLVEKFDEHRKFTLESDLNQSVHLKDSLYDAMHDKNERNSKKLHERVNIETQKEKDEIESNNPENTTEKSEDEGKKEEEKKKDKDQKDDLDKKEENDTPKNEKKGDDKDKEKGDNSKDKDSKTPKSSQQVVYSQQPSQGNLGQQFNPEDTIDYDNDLLEITESQNARNIIENFMDLTPSLRKEYFVKKDGFKKLSDAIEILGNNSEGYSLSRKERKDILNSINSEMKSSLNEDDLNSRTNDMIDLFSKLNDGNRNESINLFKELFTYNKATNLPFISEALIEKKDQYKLADILKNYSEFLRDGELTESEIENFERFIINPLNANVIKQGINDMGFLGKLKNKFNKNSVKPFKALNSSLKDLNDVKAQITSNKFISGPVYTDDEIAINQVAREENQPTNTKVPNPPQK